MIAASQITRLLRNPESMDSAAAQSLAEVSAAYPYFLPAAVLQQHNRGSLLLQENANPVLIARLFEKPEPLPELQAEAKTVIAEPFPDADTATESLIQPVFTEDYFRHQGIEAPDQAETAEVPEEEEEADKSLMVMMSFSDWLNFYKKKKEKETEEEADKRNLRTAWQKEKLAAAMEEENEEIPEQVFAMAVNSIAHDDLASEPLAGILVKQGKLDKAIDMYRQLATKNPSKSAYFAAQIEKLRKELP